MTHEFNTEDIAGSYAQAGQIHTDDNYHTNTLYISPDYLAKKQ